MQEFKTARRCCGLTGLALVAMLAACGGGGNGDNEGGQEANAVLPGLPDQAWTTADKKAATRAAGLAATFVGYVNLINGAAISYAPNGDAATRDPAAICRSSGTLISTVNGEVQEPGRRIDLSTYPRVGVRFERCAVAPGMVLEGSFEVKFSEAGMAMTVDIVDDANGAKSVWQGGSELLTLSSEVTSVDVSIKAGTKVVSTSGETVILQSGRGTLSAPYGDPWITATRTLTLTDAVYDIRGQRVRSTGSTTSGPTGFSAWDWTVTQGTQVVGRSYMDAGVIVIEVDGEVEPMD